MQRARQLTEIMGVLNPAPLQRAELPEFFVETGAARDPHLQRRDEIANYLRTTDNVKVLVTGHPGTGKSTELVKFQEEHDSEFAFFSFSLSKEAQQTQASIETLLVLIVETIVRAFEDHTLGTLDEQTLESIYGWFSETFEIKEKDLRYGAEVGAGVNVKDTFWGKLLGLSAFLKADIKMGSRTVNRSITKDNKRLSELAVQCNLLIREARVAVKETLGREMLLILEDLDKVSIQAADEVFIQNPAPLSDLECKAIYTAPIWLLCNPRSAVLDASFKRVNIPMIKVRTEDKRPCDEGIDTVKSILDSRMDVNALIEDEALRLAIDMTAGVLRHLFDILTTAAQTAGQAVKHGRNEKKIIAKDVRYGLDRLKADLVRRIGVFGLPEEFLKHEITVEKMFKRLGEIHQHGKSVESDPLNLLLLQAHAIIEYNGRSWHRVHPLVAEYMDEQYGTPSASSPQSS